MRNEFDQFADSYDATLKASFPAGMDEDQYFARYKIDFVARVCKGRNIDSLLDFGCGAGRSLEYLGDAFPHARLCGYDPSSESIRFASQRVAKATLSTEWIDLQQERFDLAFAANVFHHIPRNEVVVWLQRCRKVLSQQGRFFVFEHNPFNPVTRYIFERCPFDVDAKMIRRKDLLAMANDAGLKMISTSYTLFFPKPLKIFRPLERVLGWLPLGAQYCVEFGVW
jgi:SAM-dependent methyltransferase